MKEMERVAFWDFWRFRHFDGLILTFLTFLTLPASDWIICGGCFSSPTKIMEVLEEAKQSGSRSSGSIIAAEKKKKNK